MVEPRALVKNASDEEQVKEARLHVRHKREVELDDLKAIVSMPEGRRFISRLLTKFKIAGRVWTPSAEIHRNAGIQEAGQFILGEVIQADRGLAAQLLSEAYERELKGETDV
jgi:hypothetical protein